MELEPLLLRGRVRDRVRPVGVLPRHLELQVLPGVEGHRPVELDDQAAGVPRDVLERHDGADVVLDRMHLDVLVDVDVGLDDDVGARLGAAGEQLALVALEVHERERARVTVVDVAVEHLALARRARAVGARVRQPDAVAEAGVEDGLVLAALDLTTEWLDGDRERLHSGSFGSQANSEGAVCR